MPQRLLLERLPLPLLLLHKSLRNVFFFLESHGVSALEVSTKATCQHAYHVMAS